MEEKNVKRDIRLEYDADGRLAAYDAATGEELGGVVTIGDLQPEVEDNNSGRAHI